MEEDAKNIMDGEEQLKIGVENDETLQQNNGNKKKVGVLWAYHEIKRIGKRNDVGMWRRKKKKRTTKNKMDGRNTRKNCNEFGEAEGCDTGKKTMEGVLFGHR